MQTLGLSGETKRSDNWLKSIFWPAVENAWDVNYLGCWLQWDAASLYNVMPPPVAGAARRPSRIGGTLETRQSAFYQVVTDG